MPVSHMYTSKAVLVTVRHQDDPNIPPTPLCIAMLQEDWSLRPEFGRSNEDLVYTEVLLPGPGYKNRAALYSPSAPTPLLS